MANKIFHIGDRIELNYEQRNFIVGTSGIITDITGSDRIEIELDHLPGRKYYVSSDIIELDGWFGKFG
jgi:hypothetical protein